MNRSYIRQAQSWPTIHLGDIAQFSNGVNFDKSSYSSEGIRLIGVSNFADRLYPEFDDLSCIQPDAITENDLLAEQDIIFVRSNGNKELVGRSMFIKTLPARTTYSGFCIRARMKDTTKVCPLFYAYYFKSPLFRKSISGVSRGSNIQNLNQGILKSCNVPCPPLAEQRRIADILSAYDDLIENNRKQIKLLEEAAQRLYKEWFIDLHFPGYEHTKIINGIPEGWKKERVENIIVKGQKHKTIPTSEYKDQGKIPIIDQSRNFIAGYTDKSDLKISHLPTIIFGDHTRILKLILFPFVQGADGTKIIQSACQQVPERLLYCSLVNIDLSNYHYARHFKFLKNEEILIPDKVTAQLFETYAKKIFQKVQICRDQNLDLEKNRDILLLKLMNNEIVIYG